MKPIDEYKKEILLKIMSVEEVSWEYIKTLPKDNSLRTFICELSPMYAYRYAYNVDKSPRIITRKESCKDPQYAYLYAKWVDKSSRSITRKAAYVEFHRKQMYIETFGE
jgi:hypothetical protein